MNINKSCAGVLLLAAVLAMGILRDVVAQGSFTPPPGAPGPVMRSLDQVEARTPITNTTSLVTISQPGSYYLTGNLTVSTGNGIVIATNGVTLDLNGFTIRSTSPTPSGSGVLISDVINVLIKNGFIQGTVTNNGSNVYSGGGFNEGILAIGVNAANITVASVSVVGCWSAGIELGAGGARQFLAESCLVRTIAQDGIIASVVSRCLASDVGNRGIMCDRASDSHGESTSAISLYVGLNANHVAINSSGKANAGTGLEAICAINCDGTSNTGIGLSADTANTCSGFRTGGTAVKATIGNGCYARSGTNNITHKYNMP